MGKVISTLLFQPPDQPTRLSSKKYFWLTTSTGSKIPAFYIQQHHARYSILYSHGNAEDLGMIYSYLEELSQLLYINILAYDYSGYGMGSIRKDNIANKIEASEENCYADIEAALHHLTQTEQINLSQIILYGRSVGSGPSCYLAKKISDDGESFAGLILHSPFLSVCRVVIDMGFEMTYDVFPNISRIKDVGCPTFIIHGTKDQIVPYRHGKGLYESLPEKIRYPPFWAENMGHNNIEVQMTSVFIKRLQKYLLHIRKQQGKEANSDNSLLEQYTTLQNQLEFSFSIEYESEVAVSDSEDEIAINNSKCKGVSTLFSRSKSEKSSNLNNNNIDDEDRSPSATTNRLKAVVPFYTTLAPKSREEIECLMRRSISSEERLL